MIALSLAFLAAVANLVGCFLPIYTRVREVGTRLGLAVIPASQALVGV